MQSFLEGRGMAGQGVEGLLQIQEGQFQFDCDEMRKVMTLQ